MSYIPDEHTHFWLIFVYLLVEGTSSRGINSSINEKETTKIKGKKQSGVDGGGLGCGPRWKFPVGAVRFGALMPKVVGASAAGSVALVSFSLVLALLRCAQQKALFSERKSRFQQMRQPAMWPPWSQSRSLGVSWVAHGEETGCKEPCRIPSITKDPPQGSNGNWNIMWPWFQPMEFMMITTVQSAQEWQLQMKKKKKTVRKAASDISYWLYYYHLHLHIYQNTTCFCGLQPTHLTPSNTSSTFKNGFLWGFVGFCAPNCVIRRLWSTYLISY